MKLYRFSPITSEKELREAIEYLHFESFRVCLESFGEYLPTAGNIGIFCHYQSEYEYLTELRKKLTDATDNFNQKYFKLHTPIVIPKKGTVPETVYEYLYIRTPDPYRHHVGDIDFCVLKIEYEKLKSQVGAGEISGARVFPEERLAMIELHNPDSDILAYVTVGTMADKIRKVTPQY